MDNLTGQLRQQIFFLLFLVMVFNADCLFGQSCVCGTRKPAAAERLAASQLYLARQARDAGDMATARLLWADAEKCVRHHPLPKPAWLETKPVSVAEPVLPSMEERLARIASLPYELADMLLSDILERDPANNAARQLHLSMAASNGDRQQVSRHRSILDTCRTTGWKTCLWYATGIILLALIAFQLVSLNQRLPA